MSAATAQFERVLMGCVEESSLPVKLLLVFVTAISTVNCSTAGGNVSIQAFSALI